jgi:hypothetical protein
MYSQASLESAASHRGVLEIAWDRVRGVRSRLGLGGRRCPGSCLSYPQRRRRGEERAAGLAGTSGESSRPRLDHGGGLHNPQSDVDRLAQDNGY